MGHKNAVKTSEKCTENLHGPYFNFNVSRFLVYCKMTLYLCIYWRYNSREMQFSFQTLLQIKFFLRDFNLRTRSLWVSLYQNLVSLYYFLIITIILIWCPYQYCYFHQHLKIKIFEQKKILRLHKAYMHKVHEPTKRS